MSNLLSIGGAGNPAGTGFYKHLLDQSIKLNDDDSPYLHRTPASAGNRRTWTWSAWVKFGAMSHSSGQITLFDASSSGSDQHGIVFSGQQFYVFGYASGFTYRKMLTALHRDPAAWYHYTVAFDTTDSTASDRIKIYVNGVRQTSFDGTNTDPSLNFDTGFNNTVAHGLGARVYDGANFFDGYIAEVNMIDGTALTAASFGETKDGIWTPRDTSSLTFGTNGFHLTFKDDVVSEGFNTVTYTGTGASNSISGVGFKPALIWIKNRVNTTNNAVFDYVRGNQLWLEPNSSNGDQDSGTNGVQSHDADGWTMGSGNDINRDGEGHAAWCWEAGGTPTADNSASAGATPTAGSVKIDGSNLGSALAGSIAATRLSANTTQGFSVVTFTSNGNDNQTVAHGLGAVPKWIIVKNRSADGAWVVGLTHTGFDWDNDYYQLSDNGAKRTDGSGTVFGADPTSTLFTFGSSFGSNGTNLVAYCWTEISGYSKFGSFTGNGGSQAIDVGFAPAFVLLKRSSNTSSWGIFDNTRQSRNLQMLTANSTAVETTNAQMTFSGNTFNDNGYLSDNGETVLYAAFADTREAAFFKDVTTNGNHFTPVNLDYRDSVPDTPTNNFATFNVLEKHSASVLSEGSLVATSANANDWECIGSTMHVSSGKWYCEVLMTGATGTLDLIIGVARSNSFSFLAGATFYTPASNFGYYASVGDIYSGGSLTGDFNITYGVGDIIGIAIDMDNLAVYFAKNNTYINSGDPTSGASKTGLSGALLAGASYQVAVGAFQNNVKFTANFGQDSSFAGNHATANSNADANGHGSFAYAPPSGYLALCSQNLPDVDIIDGTENFNTVLYTGNGGTQAVTGVGFSPDWVWLKGRSRVTVHSLHDVLRGTKLLQSNATDGDQDNSNYLTAYGSDGFTVGDSSNVNHSSATYVSWNWLAGTAFSNDASATGVGTIDSEGQVNTTAGFSIIKWTANNSVATIAHGLGAVPSMYIMKAREDGENWWVYHKGIASDAETDYLLLESNGAAADYTVWNDTAPTSTVFSVGSSSGNNSNENNIGYFFTDIEGYSKAGSYVGNGNADGPFIHTGFRPSWIMIKNITDSGEDWEIHDATRDPFNVTTKRLKPNTSGAEVTATFLDFVSNGVKLRSTGGGYNASGKTFIYLAFASSPFKYANAR